ncbi:Rieske 2Fe-2S domain-containing protein [Actinokineospora diospyrosa]|uniref:Rieske [2Fe-2S] domain-containing protein n=1 Tax=Actinokineospora diospyrosa TaxID=103728 RepID=A0ABT1ILV4_9PSEU|nr:Rieske 2Fe-2S domain-containing protein [Actinokineospora diospyrosa]MCP2273486.1 Rieske [2Fe-2S] domain-containing protein [Actinokineospora diospyrosa]
MLVLTFAVAGVGNCAEVGGVAYVYARTSRGSFVAPARCSHRGGPLHLASIDASGNRLLCPWHEQPTSMTRLLRKGIPAVRSGNRVTAVFAVDAGTDTATTHRPLSPDLCGPRRAD